jgi:hypothetical protein
MCIKAEPMRIFVEPGKFKMAWLSVRVDEQFGDHVQRALKTLTSELSLFIAERRRKKHVTDDWSFVTSISDKVQNLKNILLSVRTDEFCEENNPDPQKTLILCRVTRMGGFLPIGR